MDQVSQAIADAQKVAAAVQLPATTAPQSAQLPVGVGRVRTLDDALASAGANIEVFTKITAYGYSINNEVIKTFDGDLVLDDIKVPFSVRFSVGGTTKFARSYDGVREAGSGRSWADIVAEAMRLDPKCRGQYDCAEIPIILSSSVTAGGKTYEAGTRFGITTSVTGYKPFMAWLNDEKKKDPIVKVIRVRASIETKTKAGQQPYGCQVLTKLNS